MKSKITMLLLLVFLSAIIVNAQTPVYPKPTDKDRITFGQKPPAPSLNASNEMISKTYDKKKKYSTYIIFDSVLKQFIVNTPDQATTRYLTPQTNSTKSIAPVTNNAKPSPAGFHLTKDINTSTGDSYPSNYSIGGPFSFAVLNNVSYFSADDGVHGRELWRSDGTAAGTYMVKDINPTDTGSNVSGIIAAHGLLFFSAESGDSGNEPWVSDGTTAGTHLLKDINAGLAGSYPNQFVKVNGSVFFVTNTIYGGYNTQLWKTDGTEAGTVAVTDLQQTGIGQSIFELTAVNDMVYFTAYTWSSGYQLFRSDGTEAGTYTPKQIGYNQYYDQIAPMQLTAYNNKLYFSADDGSGRRLWVSDGTFDGTGYAPGFNDVFMQPDYLSLYNNTPFQILNNVLFISGYTYADGSGLYKYDASNAGGIVLVKDLTATSDIEFIVPTEMRIVNNTICFKVINNADGHDELWSTKGESANTTLIRSFAQGEQTYNLYNGNGTLYFARYDNIYGNELWKSDGTATGTILVSDIFPGKGASYPENLTFCNGKLLFRATDISAGNELWASDGKASGTILVKDINYATTGGSNAGYMFKGICSTGNGVVFNAFTPALGGELYKSDGTTTGTVLLNDIATGTDWSFPNSFIFKNNVNYFVGDDATGTAIYKTNGNAGGLKRIIPYINRDIYYVVNYNVTDNGLVFYTLAYRSTGSMELWRSDGTDAGTYMLTPNLYYYTSNYVINIGNTVFFIAANDATGYELWKTDGTIAGTKMVKDIYTGANSSSPYSLFVYKKELYFGAWDGTLNYSLWKSDGTNKGTTKLISLTPAYYNSSFNTEPQHVFCISNGTLYFNATDFNAYGAELWKTNGTTAGTKLVKDINPSYYSNPSNLADVNGTLFFTADDGTHGYELWSTTGTTASTKMVKDITPDLSSTLTNLCSANGKLYFLNNGVYPSNQLWSSDGTAKNTQQITDAGLKGVYNLTNLTPAGNKLFFGGTSLKYGPELYEGDAAATLTAARLLSEPAIQEIKENTVFDALLYPNPAHRTAALQISGEAKKVSVTINDISGKLVWQGNFNNPSKINLPTEKLVAGVYLITVNNGIENKNIKLVKE